MPIQEFNIHLHQPNFQQWFSNNRVVCLHKNALKVHPGFKIQHEMLKFLNFYMHFYNIFIHPTSTLGNLPPPKKIVVLSFPVTMFDNHHLQWTLLFSSNTFLYMYIKHNSRLHQQSDLLCRLVKLFLIDRLYMGMQKMQH